MSIVRNLLLCLILLLLGSSLVAFEVSTKLSIGRPLKGKPFYLSIVVKGVEGDAEPFISFDPGRIVVRGRKLDKSGQLYNRGSGKTVAVRDFLFKYTQMEPTPLEISESIDMLRVIENGLKVRMVETQYETHAVDTLDDLKRVELLL